LLATRILTGLLLGTAVTAVILLLPTRAAAAVLGVLWLLGAWEWAGLAGLQTLGRSVYTGVFAAAMGYALWAGVSPGMLYSAVVAAVIGWIVAFVGVLTYPRAFSGPVVLAAGIVALWPAWVLLAEIHAVAPALALTALALVWAADVGAYFVGRSVGRIKLAPRVSPGKTWEGVSGGVLLAVAVAWVASIALGVSSAALVAVAVATALVSVVGDLTVSMLKRNRGLKDAGTLLPGHGGVMDRIDGLVAAIPFFALGLYLAGLAF
jgi:phosphatidate cytidylyltransferase